MDASQLAADIESRGRGRRLVRRYDGLDKVAVVQAYLRGGKKEVSRLFGFIPQSTVRCWSVALGTGRPLGSMGRPKHLNTEEEDLVTEV